MPFWVCYGLGFRIFDGFIEIKVFDLVRWNSRIRFCVECRIIHTYLFLRLSRNLCFCFCFWPLYPHPFLLGVIFIKKEGKIKIFPSFYSAHLEHNAQDAAKDRNLLLFCCETFASPLCSAEAEIFMHPKAPFPTVSARIINDLKTGIKKKDKMSFLKLSHFS